MSTVRRILQLNHTITGGNTITPAIQVPNGATNLTIQFSYSGLDQDVVLTMQQSLNGIDYDTCVTDSDEPLTVTLDHTTNSMTLNITDLLSMWIRFTLDICDATTGTIDKLFILMQ